MKIAIDARGATWYHGTGIGTYTENLIANILNIDKNNEYMLYWSGGNYERFRNGKCKIVMTSRRHQRFFQHHYFPKNLQDQKINLYHVPQNGIGLLPEINCLKIATIHDIIPYIMPETVGRGYLAKFLREMPYIVENSHAIITVSEHAKRDILRFFPIDEEKIFVTHLAANNKFKQLNKQECKQKIKLKYNLSNKFILYMGGFSDRKNVHTLIEAFSKVYNQIDKEYKLVILGSYRDSSQKLIKLVNSLNMQEHILFLGFISEDDVPLFYNSCDAFVYPSLYEGFGLPPLEAMSCGAPVITSNVTSIPEVVGDAGILINPLNINELTDAMGNVLSDENLRKDLSSKGTERANHFSWEITAKKTLDVYNKVLNESLML